MTTRIIPDMSAADYHAHPAVSKSILDKIAKSPLHAKAYIEEGLPEPTPAMLFGTAYHMAVLEPERFANTYVVFEGDRRTKQGKADYESLITAGASIISRSDLDAITAMSMAVRNHPDAGPLLQGGLPEASIFWKDQDTGIECRCRPDYMRGSIPDCPADTLVDLKSCEDASPAAFARSVHNYRYHVQAAHYMHGACVGRFVFIAQEKKPPYAVAVYELDEDAIKQGLALRNRDLQTYASCREFNIWPGYPAGIQTLSLPKWAAAQEVE